MNHCVPDFEIQMDDDEEYPIPVSKKPSTQNDDEIMELLWQNGHVVMQSQNQRPFRKPPPQPNTNGGDGVIPDREIRSSEPQNYATNQHLFMQEDEMASWLHYPIHEDPPPPFNHHDFCADIFYPPPNATASQNNSAAAEKSSVCTEELRPPPNRPPIPPPRRPPNRIHNFAHFSKHGNASSSSKAAPPTVVDSCDTPAAAAERAEAVPRSSAAAGLPAAASGGREMATCDVTVTSSPGGSSGSAEPDQREPVADRKRKGREAEESEFQSEDVDFESPEAKKQVRSTSAKRSRAAEVHNLSERRRRDRINEKMKALQELIPRCNKSDKASMLDEAIEYLKSLQLQVQMMSMGCGMLPMMFPGIQQYIPPMAMGVGMGMGMEMGMGMNRPVMAFPNMLASSTLPVATAAAHLGPRFPMPPPFHMPHVPVPDSSRMQPANQSDNNMLNSLGTLDPDQSCIPNITDPYQQYLGLQQAQLQLMQAMNQPNDSKPSTSRSQENQEKHQSDQT